MLDLATIMVFVWPPLYILLSTCMSYIEINWLTSNKKIKYLLTIVLIYNILIFFLQYKFINNYLFFDNLNILIIVPFGLSILIAFLGIYILIIIQYIYNISTFEMIKICIVLALNHEFAKYTVFIILFILL